MFTEELFQNRKVIQDLKKEKLKHIPNLVKHITVAEVIERATVRAHTTVPGHLDQVQDLITVQVLPVRAQDHIQDQEIRQEAADLILEVHREVLQQEAQRKGSR